MRNELSALRQIDAPFEAARCRYDGWLRTALRRIIAERTMRHSVSDGISQSPSRDLNFDTPRKRETPVRHMRST